MAKTESENDLAFRSLLAAHRAVRFALADLRCELAWRKFSRELKAHFNPSQPRAPSGSPDGGQWVGAGGGVSPSTGRHVRSPQYIPAQARGGRRGGFGAPPSDPLAEFRVETFNRTLDHIRRLEPNNRELRYIAPPNYVPSQTTVNRMAGELESARDRVSERIGRHSFEQGHGDTSFGGAGEFELRNIARNTMSDPRNRVQPLPRGRTAFYNRRTNTLVIVDPESEGGGSVFKPTNGERYLDDLARRR